MPIQILKRILFGLACFLPVALTLADDVQRPNIIVAGRCVSSDRLANSGLRVQASCMGMGQAAGAAATLAAMSGATPLEVPLGEIHALLREHGQIIPGQA